MRYMVDSDWAIDYMNERPQTVRYLDRLQSDGIGISVVSVAEIYEGVLGSADVQKDRQRMFDFLSDLEVIYLNIPICLIFGVERARLRAMGSMIGDMDLLIGATALHYELTLLTNNHRHFARIEGLDIISV